MKFQDLVNLYEEGRYEDCLSELEVFLVLNPQDIPPLILKATVLKELVFQNEEIDSNDLSLTDFQEVLDIYQSVLQMDPDNEEALFGLLETTRFFYKELDYGEYATYIDRLAIHEDQLENVCRFKADLNYLHEKYTESISNINELLSIYEILYAHDRINKCAFLTESLLFKTMIMRENLNQDQQALTEFKKYKNDILSNNVLLYLDIGKLAFQFNDYEMVGWCGLKAVLYGNEEPEIDAEIFKFYEQVIAELNAGLEDKQCIYFVIMVQRNFREELGLDLSDPLIEAKRYIDLYPDWFIPYHFAGTYILEGGNYEEALPYFAKAVQLGGFSVTIYRYIITYYEVHHVLPEILSWPDDSPIDYYNSGCEFSEFENSIGSPILDLPLLNFRLQFFERAYLGFKAYFHENKFDANYFINQHLVAMCCNNYALALSSKRKYDEVIVICKEGLEYGTFWELYNTLADAHFEKNEYEDALINYHEVLEYDLKRFDFPNYLRISAYITKCEFKLGYIKEAEERLAVIAQEYDELIQSAEYADYEEDDLFVTRQAYMEIQNARFDLINHRGDSETLKDWQKQLESKPDDASNWYMLMQNYFQLGQYEQCIACANNYEATKPLQEMALIDYRKLHYLRGKSYLLTADYKQALHDLLIAYESTKTTLEEEESDGDFHLVMLHLIRTYYHLQDWENVIRISEESAELYDSENWEEDDDWKEIVLLSAEASFKLGLNDQAKEKIQTILKLFPRDEKALQKKKEWGSGWFGWLKK
ncbi:hypothetical protein LZQ00_04360 [Sphingobacterium sp. SRCM116780]|uniref:tetratricopeptide repeat protein n=1 Tax=Sphingobacterium sp. SRCM116780 TaxID=2907623 RepID=UPI001F3C45FF|nr:hypothetical protein [Sphingobacterium sp. SRCM116780]UIR57049.1 hypothetical protein LZQ00_04360 [Sphingobacterium sp. SRCM116780]